MHQLAWHLQQPGSGPSRIFRAVVQESECCLCGWTVGEGCGRHPTYTVLLELQEARHPAWWAKEILPESPLRGSPDQQWRPYILYERGDKDRWAMGVRYKTSIEELQDRLGRGPQSCGRE